VQKVQGRAPHRGMKPAATARAHDDQVRAALACDLGEHFRGPALEGFAADLAVAVAQEGAGGLGRFLSVAWMVTPASSEVKRRAVSSTVFACSDPS
jgi:hypothetical protein